MKNVRSLSSVAVAGTLLLLPAAAAGQDADEAFKAGLEARSAGNWTSVAEHMRRAIDLDPKESPRKVGGVRVIARIGGTEYLPHYFLGLALFEQNDCVGALQSWDESQDQGVVRSVRDAAEALRKGYAACEAKGVLPRARFNPLRAVAHKQIEEVSTHAQRVQNRGKEYLSLWQAQPEFVTRYTRATQSIAKARNQLVSADRTHVGRDLEPIATLTAEARDVLEALEADLDAAVTRHARSQTLTSDLQRRVKEAEELDRQVEEKKAFLTEARRTARQDARTALGQASSILSSRSATDAALKSAINDASGASDRLRQLLGDLDQAETQAQDATFRRDFAVIKERHTAVSNQFATVEQLMESRAQNVTPDMPARRDAARKELERATRLVNAAGRERQQNTFTTISTLLDRVSGEIDSIRSLFGPVSLEEAGVPTWLQEGARLFFQGEYAGVLTALDLTRASVAPDPKLKLHVHLFRAAAHHALWARSGETEETHRVQAAEEIEACKAIEPTFEPDERAFSPRFLSFYFN